MATTSRSGRLTSPLRVSLALIALGAVPVTLTAWLQAQSPRGGVSMWDGAIVQGTEVESYSSLEEMTRGADAVVLGQVIAVLPGRVAGTPQVDEFHYAQATVRIAEVLAGAVPRNAAEITLEIPLFAGLDSLETMQAGLPWEESVYFLRNKGESARRAGQPAAIARAESKYYRLVVMSGFIVNERGRAAIAYEAPALEALKGRAFRDVLSTVRNARSP